MGDYEDRYPEAYGRGEAPRSSEADKPKPAPAPRQTHDRLTAGLRQRVGLGTPTPGTAPVETGWRHAPAVAPEPVGTVEPTRQADPAPLPAGRFRGLGPRGYVRSSARIYEDICDRLTDNPFVDATDIDVAVTEIEVTLRGTVDSVEAARQAEAIAQETVGVTRVRNELTLRAPRRSDELTPGDRINRSIGVPRR